jgi:hypothetical protein
MNIHPMFGESKFIASMANALGGVTAGAVKLMVESWTGMLE